VASAVALISVIAVLLYLSVIQRCSALQTGVLGTVCAGLLHYLHRFG
jgi:hypothetical protein